MNDGIRLIETLRLEEGRFIHPEQHRRRMEETTREVFGRSWSVDFATLPVPEEHRRGVVKCRILYGRTLQEVSYAAYAPRTVRSLRLVEADPRLDYHLKYADRQALQALQSRRGDCDEVIIVRRGAVTDTSYSNLVFFDGDGYVTPDTFLLNGTRRQRLLAEGRIREEHLTPADLSRFRYAVLINAMLGLESGVSVPVGRIYG